MIKHILINVIPLPVFLTYYYLTMANNTLVFVPHGDCFFVVVLTILTVYNVFTKKATQFLIRNLILTLSLTIAYFIAGQMYLNSCAPMSDEFRAAITIPVENAVQGILFTGIIFILKIVIHKILTKRKSI